MKFHTTLVGIDFVSLLQNTKRKENYFFTDFFMVQFKENTEEKAGVSPSKQCREIAYLSSFYTTPQ